MNAGRGLPRGRLNPPGSEFSAIVEGKPTGLAGCSTFENCARSHACLRASTQLTFRWPFEAGAASGCGSFIGKESP
jgi:hypothetical protein